MCVDPRVKYTAPKKCRARQLYEAGERIIDTARIVAENADAKKLVDVKLLEAALANLKCNIKTFDRLNKGL